MPKSEIDEIFASSSKPKAKVLQQPIAVSSISSKSKLEKTKKRKHQATPTAPSIAETILDPSEALSTKRQKTGRSSIVSKLQSSKGDTTGDGERFRDSRGTGPRRKTEEGWLIFKEDELGINDGGGGNLRFTAFLPLTSTSRRRYTVVSFRLSVLFLVIYPMCNQAIDHAFPGLLSPDDPWLYRSLVYPFFT
ncbi:hypothetical protein L218DRAFT_1071807 [Marasmius fiardii PR-910]|nr:hypothetical protein L218DRAFT_1071807 [Marasmius fiardii PR-910]